MGSSSLNRGNELLKKVMSKKKMMPLGTVLTRNLPVKAMLDEDIECYTKAHLHQPSKQEVLVNRCLVYVLAGKLDEAAQDAEFAFNMKPFDIKAMYRLARSKKLSGQTHLADQIKYKCFLSSYCPLVWREMVDARLQYALSLGFTREQIGVSSHDRTIGGCS